MPGDDYRPAHRVIEILKPRGFLVNLILPTAMALPVAVAGVAPLADPALPARPNAAAAR
jgi:hypothetical protein